MSQEETRLKEQIQRFFTSSHKKNIELFVIVCRDAWFIDFGTLQHLTFQKEVFSTFSNLL